MGNDRLGVSVVILPPLDRNGYKMIKDRLLSSMEDLDLEFIENPKMSSGDIIIFLSPIDLPAEDWLKNILQPLTESDVGLSVVK
jgi:hypothetical protein